MRLPPSVAALAALFLAVSAPACGGDDGGDAACGPIRREAIDPAFLQHVLGDDDVEYRSQPPTSGPHQPGPQISGVVEDPLTGPIQVGLLEAGAVLLQHRPDLPAAQRRRLEDLADVDVVVAPNPDLDDPVVATAWLHKRSCGSVEVAALREFVRERLGKGPDEQG